MNSILCYWLSLHRKNTYSFNTNVIFGSRCRQVAEWGGCYCGLQHSRSSNPLGLLPEHLWCWRYSYYTTYVSTWLTILYNNAEGCLMNQTLPEGKYHLRVLWMEELCRERYLDEWSSFPFFFSVTFLVFNVFSMLHKHNRVWRVLCSMLFRSCSVIEFTCTHCHH